MGFWFFLLMFIGSSLLGELLRPKPQTQNAKPAGLGDFNVPTISKARPVPVIFGRVIIEGPNVMLYDQFKARPIKKTTRYKVQGLFGSKRKKKTSIVGYRYFIRMLLALSHSGLTTMHKLKASERVVTDVDKAFNTGPSTVGSYGLFGGDDKEGGMHGSINPISGATPGYFTGEKNLSMLYWYGYIGTTTYVKPMSIEVSRYPNALGYGAIGDDLNPAEMIYDVMTEANLWGSGIPVGSIDFAGFQAAAAILQTETLGLSSIWDNRKSCKDFIEEVLRHIDGVTYIDRASGKFTITLARGGTDPATLPIFDRDNILELTNFARTAWDQTTNEVKVIFSNREMDYKQDTAQAQDMANYQTQGRIVSTQIQYPMVTTAANASRLAWRDLRALTYPLAKCSIKTNREGYQLHPGGLFVLKWDPEGITQMVMRVTRINHGSLEDGGIQVDATQDIFSLSDSVYASPPVTDWTDPIIAPVALTIERLDEMPYQLLAEDAEPDAADDPNLARLLVLALREYDSLLYHETSTKKNVEDWLEDRVHFGGFAPSALLDGDYAKDTDYRDTAVGIDIDTSIDLDIIESATQAQVLAGLVNFAYLNDEIICFESMTDNGGGSYTLNNVWRGLLDTVPADHSDGDRIWFGYYGQSSTLDSFEEGDDIDLKNIPITSRGTLDAASAALQEITIARRAYRSYPPGYVELNGEAWPAEDLPGALVITWAHRDRTQQTGAVAQDAAGVGPEAGTTYTLRIYGEGGGLVRTYSGLAGNSQTYPITTEIADAGLGGRPNQSLRIELEAIRDSKKSTQYQDRSITCRGFGMRFGQYHGG